MNWDHHFPELEPLQGSASLLEDSLGDVGLGPGQQDLVHCDWVVVGMLVTALEMDHGHGSGLHHSHLLLLHLPKEEAECCRNPLRNTPIPCQGGVSPTQAS